ncbi:TetR/AcrR family transcriptional regulator [Sneathiella sp. HT1-7]|uniref:TetR/AcrR family transcriptional regulator n=1 Tax=Sneathiella sp. HT1-7 TaxID=2887192 RepID=UPI001D132D9F|nr:TetR/AcrR family transcriptional regulator [Sneathiella sp. HT1-7]MCC3304380.1 TetR/AcrR family transcriptional regulator [Sneathiella sp. HT1-7]
MTEKTRAREEGLHRSDNRRQELMAAAAHLFNQRGYDATSMRDIAREAGMLAGSMYYHFSSKEDLIVATYEEGKRLISTAVLEAIDGVEDPWERLTQAAVAHMNTLFGGNNFSILLCADISRTAPTLRSRLIEIRDSYDKLFMDLIEDLPLAEDMDKGLLRLNLLGSLNWSTSWYRPGGQTPAQIGAFFVKVMRDGLS